MEIRKIKIDTLNEEFLSLILQMLDENIDIAITVTGDSMFPLWRHMRDTVVLTKCDKTALRKGDIPLYRRKTGQYVMHRIIKANKDSYNLCGDVQTQIEYNLSAENIIAVVKAFTRKGKEYNCNNLMFKIYTAFWIWILPFRGIVLKVYRITGR